MLGISYEKLKKMGLPGGIQNIANEQVDFIIRESMFKLIINVGNLNLMFAEDEFWEGEALRDVCNRQSNKDKKRMSPIHEFIAQLDAEHNSEDEGIEDYVLGGYHPVHVGEVLLKRYVVIQKLGWGHFSTVWLCRDFKYNTYVAVKIQKSSPHYMEAAFDQVQILQTVQMRYQDPAWKGTTRDDTHVVGLLNAFVHKTPYGNHFCMVFEILRCNLLDILKRYEYEGVPLDICQQISKQILEGLDYLHRICGVIHTDLKPENVMVCLNDDEIKQIIQNGQLKNNELFAERTKLIQQYMGVRANAVDAIASEKNNKVNALTQKLKNEQLTKNQKKNLKKRIRKEKQKENQGEDVDVEHVAERKFNLAELFDLRKGKIQINRGGKLSLPLKVKIADLGNACWKHHSFSTQIQTRQYRSPQVILGQKYNETADIWSLGCMMYEMLTGDLMFQPKKTDQWGKNDDHLAQMQELLGEFDINFIARSPKMKRYFLKNGKMKKFPSLNNYSLSTVLQLKNKILLEEAQKFAQFLLPMLTPEQEKRVSAETALKHPWLKMKLPHSDFKMSEQEHREIKKKFYENQAAFRVPKKSVYYSDASCEDNQQMAGEESSFKKKKYKLVNVRLVDRSFTDLGYVGFSEGIDLQKLDSCSNWQFS